MNPQYIPKWFSEPCDTIEQAQELHQPEPLSFDPACVVDTGNGYSLGLLRQQLDWPPVATIQHIEETTGFKVVATCEPLMGIWNKYPKE